MTNVEFHLQLNHNVTWNMSRLHFHDHYELLLPLTSPGNIFVNDQVYPLSGAPCTSSGRTPSTAPSPPASTPGISSHIGRKALTELSTPRPTSPRSETPQRSSGPG